MLHKYINQASSRRSNRQDRQQKTSKIITRVAYQNTLHDLELTVTVLKKFPNFKFSIETPGGKRRLQIFIYLLEVFHIDLGYEYQWPASYPFSRVLDKNMRKISELYNADQKLQKISTCHAYEPDLDHFRNCIKERESDDDFITTVTLLHWLRSSLGCTNDEIIQKVTRRSVFTEEQVCAVLKELRQWDSADMIFGIKDGGRFLDEHSELCERHGNNSII